MSNIRKQTTNRGLAASELYERAATEVANQQISYRDAAKSYNLCHVTLYRYIKKKQKMIAEGTPGVPKVGYVSSRRVFSDEEETELRNYLLHCSAVNYGLTTKEVRKLAYELARKNNKNIPNCWETNKCAGGDWLTLFLKRNPRLSIRAPQPTSLARASSFNKSNVEMFFKHYSELMDRYHFTPSAIWNMDETGITTVQKPNRVLARRGTKQVSAMTSAERGVLVTVATAVSAIGNSIPPMFIFPRKRFKDHFIRDGPVGSVGSANGSGWMQEDDFYIFLEHFKTHVRPSRDDKCLILLDNHNSHITLKAIDFCRDNGIVLLTFPPHCTHKMQPLDCSVFGPLKKAVNTFCDNWMRTNPGKVMTIYDIPGIVRDSFPLAVTLKNVLAGFGTTGIWPINPNIFTDLDFLPSSVTDRPLDVHTDRSTPIVGVTSEVEEAVAAKPYVEHAVPSLSLAISPVASTSLVNNIQKDNERVSPYNIKPLPKAGPRANTGKGRKTRKSAIITDTPNKLEIEEEERKRKAKSVKRSVFEDNENTISKKGKNAVKKPQKKKPIRNDSSDEDNEEYFCLVCVEPFSNSRPKEKWNSVVSAFCGLMNLALIMEIITFVTTASPIKKVVYIPTTKKEISFYISD